MPTEQDVLDTLNSKSDEELMLAIDSAPKAEADPIRAFLKARLKLDLHELTGEFEQSSDKFIKLISQLDSAISKLPAAPSGGSKSPLLEQLAAAASDAYRLYYDRIAPYSATASDQEAETPLNDEKASPPGTTPPLPTPPSDGKAHLPPKNTKDYSQLAAEYLEYFAAAKIWPSVPKVPDAAAIVRKNADRATANKSRYLAVGDPLGIPWWFIAGIHQMESGYNFGTHLHNGDSLAARTHRVPAGRPKAPPASGHFPYTWEESAADALTMEGLNGLSDWSLSRALYRWEAYNGFGYRAHGVPTPYLWSFTTIYTSGRYVADHKFDPNSVSQQCGTAALLRELVNRGTVKP